MRLRFYLQISLFVISFCTYSVSQTPTDSRGPYNGQLEKVTMSLSLAEHKSLMSSKNSYQHGGYVLVEVNALHGGVHPIAYRSRSLLLRFRPTLRRNGVGVPYLPSVLKEIEKLLAEEEQSVWYSGVSVKLLPGKSIKVATLDLSKWYGILEQGSYLLNISCEIENRIIDSDPILFNVQ